MSKTQNQEFHFWEVVEDHLRRKSVNCHKGNLSRRDAEAYAEAIFLQGLALDDILIDAIPDRRSRIVRWQKLTIMIPPTVIGSAIKSIICFLRNYGETLIDYTDFKHLFIADFPSIGDYMSPIKEEVTDFLQHPSASSFFILNLHLQFISKLSLLDVDFSQQCMQKYLEVESHLETFKHDYLLYDELNVIIREWLSEFTYEGFHPRHGPGGVASLGRCSKQVKYEAIGSDPLISYFLARTELADYIPVHSEQIVDRCCEVVFVPKSMTSWRTISMEPVSLQFYQQGIWGCLDRYMRHHEYLRKHIFLHDQSHNRDLAKIGSANRGSYGTIDLSDASDTVSWEMVKRVFRGTELLRGCYATRSRCALLPNGDRVSLHKYAPMGSALCFPIECLVFSAVCEYALRTSAGCRVKVPYSVFGDDLVVSESLTGPVIELLTRCGFKVNTDKTFIKRFVPFRESCGGEYYCGVDVTPFRLSRKFSSELPSTSSPDIFQAHVDSANRAYQYNLKKVRLWFIHRLISLPQKVRPRFGDDFRSLYSDTPTNFHLKTKWSIDWQCPVTYFGTSVPIAVTETESDEAIRLHEWFCLARFRLRRCFTPEDVIRADVTRPRSKLGTTKFSNYCMDPAFEKPEAQ